jgi:hypothetical protein
MRLWPQGKEMPEPWCKTMSDTKELPYEIFHEIYEDTLRRHLTTYFRADIRKNYAVAGIAAMPLRNDTRYIIKFTRRFEGEKVEMTANDRWERLKTKIKEKGSGESIKTTIAFKTVEAWMAELDAMEHWE